MQLKKVPMVDYLEQASGDDEVEFCLLELGPNLYGMAYALVPEEDIDTVDAEVDSPTEVSWRDVLSLLLQVFHEGMILRRAKIPGIHDKFQPPYWLPRNERSCNSGHLAVQKAILKHLPIPSSPIDLVSLVVSAKDAGVTFSSSAHFECKDNDIWVLSNPNTLAIAGFSAEELLQLLLSLLASTDAAGTRDTLVASKYADSILDILQRVLASWTKPTSDESSHNAPDETTAHTASAEAVSTDAVSTDDSEQNSHEALAEQGVTVGETSEESVIAASLAPEDSIGADERDDTPRITTSESESKADAEEAFPVYQFDSDLTTPEGLTLIEHFDQLSREIIGAFEIETAP